MEPKDVVSPSDILQKRGVKWYLNGNELQPEQVENLRAEADLLRKTSLWKILVNEGKYHAQKRAMIDTKAAKNEEEKLIILNDALAYHDVVVMFEQFILNFTKK